MTYQIITDATADLNEELLSGLPEVKIIPMHVEVGGMEYIFGPGSNIECGEFTSICAAVSLPPLPRSIQRFTGIILKRS